LIWIWYIDGWIRAEKTSWVALTVVRVSVAKISFCSIMPDKHWFDLTSFFYSDIVNLDNHYADVEYTNAPGRIISSGMIMEKFGGP